MQDELYMARALKLAARGRFTTHPNPNVGCVIVKDGEIVGEGYHHRAGNPMPRSMRCVWPVLKRRGNRLRHARTVQSSRAYAAVLRCADCCGRDACCCCDAGSNPQVAGRGLYRLQQAGIDVSHGMMMNDVEQLNKGFLKRMRTGFPYVQLKLGASLDGRTAMASGESQWITSPQARRDVQRLRAQSHAILTSSATVLADDPSLPSVGRSLMNRPGAVSAGKPASANPHCSRSSKPGHT